MDTISGSWLLILIFPQESKTITYNNKKILRLICIFFLQEVNKNKNTSFQKTNEKYFLTVSSFMRHNYKK